VRPGILWGALAASALMGDQAASAAEIFNHNRSAPQRGAFAGARLRLPFGGGEKARAGFAIAPMQRSWESGRVGLGSGVEVGVTRRGKLEFGAAGRSLHLGQKQHKSGISTIGWVAIGAGAAALLYVGLFTLCQETNCTNSD
jgi:hypothetical protein